MGLNRLLPEFAAGSQERRGAHGGMCSTMPLQLQTHREVEVMMEAGIEEGLILWPQRCQADGASGGHSRPVQRDIW